jgi:hypothetical protein
MPNIPNKPTATNPEDHTQDSPERAEPVRNFRRIRDYGGIEAYMRLRVEEREKRTGKKLTIDDLP